MPLFIISGFSQSGKTTLVNLLLKEKNTTRVITSTTRKPRPGEKDKIDYYFLKEEDFKDKSKFIETAIVHGFYYGTLKKEVENNIKSNKNVFWVIDVQGADNLLKNYKELPEDTITIFLTTEKLSQLIERINQKKDPNIEKREKSIKKELNYIHLFKYLIDTSKNIKESLEDIKAIIYNNKEKIKKIEEFTKKFNTKEFLES